MVATQTGRASALPSSSLQRGRTPYPASSETKVKGQDYLEVAHRIAWMRGDYPAARVETSAHSISATGAVMKAVITLVSDDGVIEGTGSGYGAVRSAEFENFIEKAETKAIGRALGSLGYGTAVHLESEILADAPRKNGGRS